MFPSTDSILTVPGVGKKYQTKLENLGIKTVGDFLYHFPHRYDDFSEFKKIDEVTLGETVTIQGRVSSAKTTQAWKRKMTITEAYIEDDTGSIKATWFNTPAPLRYLNKGKAIRISGKTGIDKKNEMFFSHPNFEFIPVSSLQREQSESIIQVDDDNSYNTGIMAPIYPETAGLKSFWFRRIMKDLLSEAEVIDFIPQDILKSQNIIALATALQHIHFPRSAEEVTLAKKRFAFEKIFLIQLKSLLAKKDWAKKTAPKIPFNEKYIKAFVKDLPFVLTNSQKKCTWQIIKDLEKNQPMNRLLEGDVGTGKTVVSAIATLSVINQLYQVALLAPTEVLAVQHYKSLRKFFKNLDFTIAILTRSEVKCAPANKPSKKVTRPKLLEKLANGKIDLIIGTHAIIQKDVIFKNIGLAIIDEQHRFGVRQRAFLQQESVINSNAKEVTPHLLSMTATPIPRTLSLAMFSNLDLSIIDEFPAGRKKIITKVVNPQGRGQVHQFIKTEVKSGRQVFIIFPLVEETSKMSEVKAATEERARLQKDIFPEFKLGLLHGKMKPKEKNAIMKDFQNKKIDILVATSVVEVGVDIPNASIMIIEGAERFGLAQLHQFRGRVGRGKHQSYCFLFTSDSVADTTTRLNVLEKTNDGFKISEADLKLRGPGQFMGTAQSGLPDIAMESLSDVKTIEQAKIEAQRILNFDPDLKKFPALKTELEKMNTVVHNE
jgi:ATP-dependent DNA helicase RecG